MISVAIEARRLQDRPPGGVGRSLANLLPPLCELVDATLLVDDRLAPVTAPCPVARIGVPGRLPGSVWLHGPVRRWAARERPDVFHGTFNAIPVGLRCPAVVTIHDLSFEVHPEDFTAARRKSFQVQARYAARKARTILTVSQFSADQIAERYRVDANRLVALPWPVDPTFSPQRATDAPAVARRLGIDGPYVVAVGGARRRGSEVAVAAWQQVRARGLDVTLVVVGHGEAPAEGVVAPGRVDDESWTALLAGAQAFLYPTRYEGFGMPALEGAASGTPVICAPVASLPEVLGPDAAEWCDEPTVDAIAAGLERVLTDTDRAQRIRTGGLAWVAACPTWAEIAQRTAQVYENAAG